MNDRQRTIDDLELLNRLCHGTVLDDAIALLKEQEAAEPEIQIGEISLTRGDPELVVYCGACKQQIIRKYEDYPVEHMRENYRFCHHCGRKVKWE